MKAQKSPGGNQGKAISNGKGSCKDSDHLAILDREALKKLYALIEADNARRYPSNPYPLQAKRLNLRKTADLTKAVMKWLHLHGWHCERTGNEGRVVDNRETVTDVLGRLKTIGSVQRIYGTGTRGTSDLKAVINGRFVAIEIKNDRFTNDRQSQAQKEYQEQIEKSGGVYIIVRSFGEFVEAFERGAYL